MARRQHRGSRLIIESGPHVSVDPVGSRLEMEPLLREAQSSHGSGSSSVPGLRRQVSTKAQTVPVLASVAAATEVPISDHVQALAALQAVDIDFAELLEPLGEAEISDGIQNDAQAEYWYALRNAGAVFRLEKYLYVLQNWNEKECMLEVCYSVPYCHD